MERELLNDYFLKKLNIGWGVNNWHGSLNFGTDKDLDGALMFWFYNDYDTYTIYCKYRFLCFHCLNFYEFTSPSNGFYDRMQPWGLNQACQHRDKAMLPPKFMDLTCEPRFENFYELMTEPV